MIRRADDDRIDVLPIEDTTKVARDQIRSLVGGPLDALGHLQRLIVGHVAERDDLGAEAQRRAEIPAALSAAADEADANAPVGAGDAVLRRRIY